MTKFSICFFITLMLIALPGTNFASTSLNLEFGQAINTYNKAKIDGKDGTLFNLSPALNTTSYYRLSFIQKFKSRSGARFLYAPLEFSGGKRYGENINFNGVNFSAGEKTNINYKFNSYRATYFYDLISKRNIVFRLGGTLKMRDALIELKQDDRRKFKKNKGLVPLVYLYSQYKWNNNFLMTLDFDGLMAPQGRAFDIGLMAGYQFTPSTSLHLGSRILEGGADNENVYNFSEVIYYFTSLQLDF